MAYTAATITDLLKKYFEPGLKTQFWNDKILLKRLKKNRSDIHGGQATVGLHSARNPAIGAVANGAQLMTQGQQTFKQASIPLRYLYGRTWFSGPDIANSKSDKGAFARIVTANLTGMLDDMQADANRQLYSDGSGILAFASSTSSTTSLPILPYLWSPADKYFPVGTEIQTYDVTDGSTSNLTTNTRAGAAAATVASSTSTTLVTATDNFATNGAGDVVGKFGALQLADATSFTQYEMNGLYGAISDTNLIGDQYWQYDATNSTVNFTGPEGQSYDWAGPTSATNQNYFQGLSAYANTFWRSKVMGNSGVPRALTMNLLDSMHGHLTVNQGAKTSAIISSYQVRDKFTDLLRGDRRFVDSRQVDGGFEAVMYKGIPWLVDQDAPRGTAFFVDESTFSLYVAEDFGYVSDSGGNHLFNVSDYDMFETIGRLYMNLGCHCRNKNGKIIDISET